MKDDTSETEVEEIRHVLDIYHSNMVKALPEKLDACLEPLFSLTHITGNVQPRIEWLAVLRSGEFDYQKMSY